MPPSQHHDEEPSPPPSASDAAAAALVQAQLTGIVALADQAVLGTDQLQRIALFNHHAEELFGYSGQELLGQPLDLLIPHLDAQSAAGAALAVARQTATCLRKGGAAFDAHIAVARVGVAGASVTALHVQPVARQSHERSEAEARLRAHADHLTVLAAASDAFAQAGTAYQVVLEQVARHVAETLGNACVVALLTEDGQWIRPAAAHDIDPEVLSYIRAVFASSPIHSADAHSFAHVCRSGQAMLLPRLNPEALRATLKPEYWPVIDKLHIHSALVVPLRLRGQTIGVMGLTRRNPEQPPFTTDDQQLLQDVADRAAAAIGNARLFDQAQRELAARRRAEQELEAEQALLVRRVAERTADLSLANAELARALRLKDEFLANMSHELRTPLNSILGRAEALQEAIYGPVNSDQIGALHGIAESGQHLLTLINDILDLSKIEAGRLELERAAIDVDLLSTLVMRMVAQIALVKRITLTTTLDAQVQRLVADERRLKQILVNLLSNAVKFTPEGGAVGLEVSGDPEQQTVTFTVWDTGIGIAAEDLPRLFQPFVQLDNSLTRQHTGTGLGLSLVARLAQAHGGSVSVASTPGQGSRFSVTLPWVPAQAPARVAPATAVVDTTRPALRQVLVIEDSPTAAAQIARYLRALGARVEVHPHATGTIERAIALQPDVIILDLLLPDDHGWAVLRQLKAEPRTQSIPVLVISVVDEPEQARRRGAADLLVKPIDHIMLEQALRHILVAPETPAVTSALVVAPYLERPRVLIADDNEETIETLTAYLQAKGYVVAAARNGGEAIIRAQEERPDVILMDIQMPGIDGLEAIGRLRADPLLTHIPIIAVTALAMPGDRERCLSAGADEYLAKPLHLRTLIAAIEARRQTRRPADDEGRDGLAERPERER